MPGAIRYGFDAVWVTSRFTVSRIDPHTAAVTQPLQRVGDVRAAGGGALWGTYANSAEDAGVQRIDPVTGQVVATIRIPNGVLIAFGLGTLWVAQDAPTITSGGNEPVKVRPGKLYRIDPATNRVLGRPVPLPGIAPSALAVGEGAVWVGELDGKTLTRFNLVP
jgi:DNA-binding beta-propeller fold protein YncE